MSEQTEETAVAKARQFGALVRELRQTYGLTRRQLAAQCGLSCTTIKDIESARVRLNRLTLYQLAEHPAMARLPTLALHRKIVPVQFSEGEFRSIARKREG
jgi:transcriptional regulator with XRE-family HTH domain